MVFIPCADACDMGSHLQTPFIENAEEHHQEHTDTCSPFCSCSCCSLQITFKAIQAFNIISNEETRLFTNLKILFHPTIYFSIWQPPKLS